VFLLEPERTEFDLRWQMFGIPVRVHPMFWVISALMGWSTLQLGFEYLLIWIACVFISILIHELGHVFMGRAFGTEGHIILYSFGGLAVGSNALSNPWKRIAVSFAGPLAGFVYLGVLILFLRIAIPDQFTIVLEKLKLLVGLEVDRDVLMHRHTLTEEVIDNLLWINLFWGLLNLLPIWPLDGGQISRDFLWWLVPQGGLRLSLGISFLLGALLAIHALSAHYGGPHVPFLWFVSGPYIAILFGLLAFNSFQQLQQLGHRPWREDWPDRWDRG
jgi:Zn-dependent protease